MCIPSLQGSELGPSFWARLMAIWHGGGKVVLATQADSNKVAIYEFRVPKPSGESATVDPRNGNLHLAVPVLGNAKTKQ